MRYFSHENWERYQAARKTPATKRDFVQEIHFEAGRLTLQDAGIEILPSVPSTDLMISRRPWIKNFDGVVIQPEALIAGYKVDPLTAAMRIWTGERDADSLKDAKNLLNALFGEGKDGGN